MQHLAQHRLHRAPMPQGQQQLLAGQAAADHHVIRSHRPVALIEPDAPGPLLALQPGRPGWGEGHVPGGQFPPQGLEQGQGIDPAVPPGEQAAMAADRPVGMVPVECAGLQEVQPQG